MGDDQFLVQLQGYNDRSSPLTLKGSTLYYATQQDTLKKDDDILISQLAGLPAYRISDGSEILAGPALGVALAKEMCAIPGLLHDQIEVGFTRKKRGEEQQIPGCPQELVLIPLVPEIVTKIDLEKQIILIDPPAGLLDLTYVREEKVKIKGLLPPAEEKFNI